MRIETLLISLFVFAFGSVGCSQPEPVTAEYEPADCNCVEQTTAHNTDEEEAPPAETDGLAEEAVASETGELAFAGPAEETDEESGELPDDVLVEPVEPVAANAEADEPPATEKEKKKTDGATGVVNLNTASVDQLMALPGVGPSLAARIVEFRQERRFEEPKHLLRVRGIGKATYAKLAPMLAVSGPTTLAK
jgi:competence ComEA-like helix-hairpin-helix protein